MNEKVIWYENTIISPDHTEAEVTQVYVWIISGDNMVAIVTKDNGDSQLPGGHPEKGEANIKTAQREVLEEIGLDISQFSDKLIQFGYYIIDRKPIDNIQVRYLLELPKKSQSYILHVNEKADETRPVNTAKWVNLYDLPDYIPWTKDLPEYKKVMKLLDMQKSYS
jgi:8-oxo-dGTP pyrophosphatase MutT (NUDIX family)